MERKTKVKTKKEFTRRKPNLPLPSDIRQSIDQEIKRSGCSRLSLFWTFLSRGCRDLTEIPTRSALFYINNYLGPPASEEVLLLYSSLIRTYLVSDFEICLFIWP